MLACVALRPIAMPVLQRQARGLGTGCARRQLTFRLEAASIFRRWAGGLLWPIERHVDSGTIRLISMFSKRGTQKSLEYGG